MLFYDIFSKYLCFSLYFVLTNLCIIIILQICSKKFEMRSECVYENAKYNIKYGIAIGILPQSSQGKNIEKIFL